MPLIGLAFPEYEHMRIIMGENYEKWVRARLDEVKKRKERDQESHDRWVSARSELQKRKCETALALLDETKKHKERDQNIHDRSVNARLNPTFALKYRKPQPLFDGGQLLRGTVAVQMCSFDNLLEWKVFKKQPTVGVEKKVTNYWDMLPTELHVAILKIHHQETMLFYTRGWVFMKTVSGWQRIEN